MRAVGQLAQRKFSVFFYFDKKIQVNDYVTFMAFDTVVILEVTTKTWIHYKEWPRNSFMIVWHRPIRDLLDKTCGTELL